MAFVTTAGFEDTIEIGRQNRPQALRSDLRARAAAGGTQYALRRSPSGSRRGQRSCRSPRAKISRCWLAMSTPAARSRSRSRRCSPSPILRMSAPSAACWRSSGCRSRCRISFCRNSANTSAPALSSSTPTCSRSCRVTCSNWTCASDRRGEQSQSFACVRDAIERRHHLAGSRLAPAGTNGPVGTRGRSCRRGGDGPPQRFRAHHHLRHGRHVDRRRAGRWRAQGRRTKRRLPACRCAYPCSTFTPSAPVEARWHASMPAERCVSDRNPRVLIPAQSAMDADFSRP